MRFRSSIAFFKNYFFNLDIHLKLLLILGLFLFLFNFLLIEWIQFELVFIWKHSISDYLPQDHAHLLLSQLGHLKFLTKVFIWSGSGFIFCLSLYAMKRLSRWITRRVVHLSTLHEQVGAGNLDLKTTVYGTDEIGRLEASFNHMVDALAIKNKYRRLLDQITDQVVVDRLMEGKLELGGEERRASILFCDIRGFTQLSIGLAPKELVQLLNEHMTLLAEVVESHHGVIDKFIGDSLMVIFGSPRHYGKDAEDALTAAKMMHEKRLLLNQSSRIPLHMGIGIASGNVIAGCMGSPKRMNYTVIGDRVNLAARLCAKAAPGEILMDQETFELVDNKDRIESLFPLELKGFSEKVTAYRWSQ